MKCEVRGICGGCDPAQSTDASPHSKSALATKATALRTLLRAYTLPHLSIYASPDSGYRARGEFRVYKDYKPDSAPKLSLSMSARGHNSRVKLSNCPILLPALQRTLEKLMPLLESSPLLSHKLYAIEVLGSRFGTLDSAVKSATQPQSIKKTALDSTTTLYTIAYDHAQHSDVIITLIYHKPLDSSFCHATNNLLETLREALHTNCPPPLANPPHQPHATIQALTLIARSKNQKHIFSSTPPESTSAKSHFLESSVPESSTLDSMDSSAAMRKPPNQGESTLDTRDMICDVLMLDKPYTYLRQEGRFCQPNAYMNPCMLSFVKRKIHAHTREDLLEIYGGDGNFSIALAECFDKVLVTEVVKSAHALIAHNAHRNNITNITSARLSGAETISALRRQREFFRLRGVELEQFRFSHVLVDPPRSGIGDEAMLDFLASFPYIIYISCNPTSLEADLRILCQSHVIEHFALFDQFPHTSHKECALLLHKSS